MSEELEYLPDPLTDDEHKILDANVLNGCRRMMSYNFNTFAAAYLVQLIVRYHDASNKLRLDSKYGNPEAALELLEENPSLEAELKTAWEIKSFRRIRNLAILKKPLTTQQPPAEMVEASFGVPYRGAAVDGFLEYLTHNETQFKELRESYYAKFCSIVQSSGTGKSRLMMEMAQKNVLVLYVNLRAINDNGYPPRDHFPASVLVEDVPNSEWEYGGRCCTFFAAIFTTLANHFRPIIGAKQPIQIIQNWNKGMCEIGSEERRTFFRQVKENYDELWPSVLLQKMEDITLNKQRTSSKVPNMLGQKLMQSAYDAMVKTLQPLFTRTAHQQPCPALLLAFDEAHVLNQPLTFRPSDILCRAISLYSHLLAVAIWVVFASTTSRLADFAAPQLHHNSLRVKEGQRLFPPFTELGWDQLAHAPGTIPAIDAAKPENVVRFGRALWSSLRDVGQDIQQVAALAAQKLCGGAALKPDDAQALALLGQRFGLEITFGHPDSVAFLESAVASYLRICIGTTDDRSWRFTSYPSEPFLSCAAANLLHSGALRDCLRVLQRKVNDGMINLGQRGELTSRLLWLLAKDLYVRRNHTVDGSSIFSEDGELIDCQRIPVVDYFKWVFGDGFWSSSPDMQLAETAFERAYVNFTHWISMEKDLWPTNAETETADEQIDGGEWTLRHWCRTSAVQCCHGQPRADKVIPIFFEPKKGSNTHDDACMSHIFISDKARQTAKKDPYISPDDPSINLPPQSRLPFISIHLELGVEEPSRNASFASRNSSPYLLIRAHALDKRTFPFLTAEDGLDSDLRALVRPPQLPTRPFAQRLKAKMKYGATRRPDHMVWEDHSI